MNSKQPSVGSGRTPGLARVLAAVLLAGSASPGALAVAVEPVPVPDSELVLDVPDGWFPGGVHGGGILLSYVGDGTGYPRLTVTTDAEAEPLSLTPAQYDRELEALLEALMSAQPRSRLVSSVWTEINGLRALDSTVRWPSVAGEIQARRLLLSHAGRFYVFDWVERTDLYEPVADAIERSVRSIRLRAANALVGPG